MDVLATTPDFEHRGDNIVGRELINRKLFVHVDGQCHISAGRPGSTFACWYDAETDHIVETTQPVLEELQCTRTLSSACHGL